MDLRRVPHQCCQADPKPVTASHGLSQAFCSPASPFLGRRRNRNVRSSAPASTKIAHQKGINSADIKVWFADEARIGQKNKIIRRWARRGTRPSAPSDQRTVSTYIFGAICPRQGKGAGLVLPFCNTAAMNLHLAEIATAVAPKAHAVLLLDQAGWHLSKNFVIRPNITILPLPPKCPELNPVENVWQFKRDNWLSNRAFSSYNDLLDHCCDAWNRLIDQPWKIMSIGMRDWANRF